MAGLYRAELLTFCIAFCMVGAAFAQDESLFCLDPDHCCEGEENAAAFGDWDNCTIYYLCFGGRATAYSCLAPRLLFDPERKTCQEAVPGCVGGTRPPVEVTDVTHLPTETTITATTSTTTTTPRPDGNCTEEGAYYIPYPGDCKKYMICSNGELLPEVRECPSGTLFDPEIRECNLEHLVECKPTCPDSGTVSLPHDRNCSLYWLCTLGVPQLRQCPPGLVFDPVLTTCNLEDAVFCPNLCPAQGVVNLPHARDCGKYWLCNQGTPNLHQCPEGTLFDRELGQCNTAENVVCPEPEHINALLGHIQLIVASSFVDDQDDWDISDSL